MAKRKTPRGDFYGVQELELELFALALLPDIQAYFESEAGKREFAEWERQQENRQEKAGKMTKKKT